MADNALGQGDTANVNGLPASTFRVQVDGQDATSQNDTGWTSTVAAPSVDMVQEFSLQTSNYAAEFGQAGGGFYNFTTKSGTNQLHGSAYEYLTNEALDAYRPFTYVNPRSRKNDFGGTVEVRLSSRSSTTAGTRPSSSSIGRRTGTTSSRRVRSLRFQR